MNLFHQPWELVPNHIRGKGGREIDKFRGVSPALDYDEGSEAWIGSVTPVGEPPKDNPHYGCSEVLLPDSRRMYLYEAINLAPNEILGEKHIKQNGTGLGMLIKYLDAQEQYELQCHPTRDWAKKMWDSDYGKEECWHVLGTRDDTEEPAYLLLGFKEGVTRELWEKYFYAEDLKSLESLCHKIPIQAGETYFVGGGCPHALGEGCFVLEIQEPSDITLDTRTYHVLPDAAKSEMSEELYHERLLGAYIYDGTDEEENLRRWRIPRKCIREGQWGNECIGIGPDQTKYFSFTKLTVHGETQMLRTGFPQIAIVISGEGVLYWDGGEMPISKAKELFFPVDIPGFSIRGNVKLILCNPEGVDFE